MCRSDTLLHHRDLSGGAGRGDGEGRARSQTAFAPGDKEENAAGTCGTAQTIASRYGGDIVIGRYRGADVNLPTGGAGE